MPRDFFFRDLTSIEIQQRRFDDANLARPVFKLLPPPPPPPPLLLPLSLSRACRVDVILSREKGVANFTGYLQIL